MARAAAPPLVAATALACSAALLVPRVADAAYREFRSPSGQLGCAFYSDAETPRFVRCDWDGAADRAVTLTEAGRGKRVRVTDSVRNPKAKILAYGRATSFGKLRCTSRRSGITCRNGKGHGFTVSVERQRVF
ncbi:MAG TPA: DUF6636 domain-containing protein [Solirubrobacter sp.]|nr:DUF6636 domain-containing protein [Solirubrobacter sp.]